jgi:hypothetical protein
MVYNLWLLIFDETFDNRQFVSFKVIMIAVSVPDIYLFTVYPRPQPLPKPAAPTINHNYSKYSEVTPPPHRAHPNIYIRKSNPEQTQPCPNHMLPVETTYTSV